VIQKVGDWVSQSAMLILRIVASGYNKCGLWHEQVGTSKKNKDGLWPVLEVYGINHQQSPCPSICPKIQNLGENHKLLTINYSSFNTMIPAYTLTILFLGGSIDIVSIPIHASYVGVVLINIFKI